MAQAIRQTRMRAAKLCCKPAMSVISNALRLSRL